jgi:hypothetical protein
MNLYLTNPQIKPLEEIAKVILLEISRYGVLTNTLHLYVKKGLVHGIINGKKRLTEHYNNM